MANNPMMEHLVDSSKDNIWAQVFIYIGSGLLGIIGGMLLKHNAALISELIPISVSCFIGDFIITVSTAVLAGFILKFLLFSGTVLSMIRTSNADAITSKEFIKSFSPLEIKKLSETITKYHDNMSFSDNTLKKESIQAAREELRRKIKDAKSISKRTVDDDRLAKRNFYIDEMNSDRTILKNGNEIMTYTCSIEIFEDGLFEFYYGLKSNNDETEMPYMNEFVHGANRFSDYSFDARILKYTHNGQHKDSSNCLNVRDIIDNSYEKELCMTVTDCYEGDKFVLSYSISVKEEYTAENIKKLQDDFFKNNLNHNSFKREEEEVPQEETLQEEVPQEEALQEEVPQEEALQEEVPQEEALQEEALKRPKSLPGSRSSMPVGIRRIKVQQEVYGKEGDTLKLTPSLKVADIPLSPTKEYQSLFYKISEWTIFYKVHAGEQVRINIV